MTRAVLSLGSNLGDSAALLRGAVQALGAAVVGVSSVYRTPPWGPVAQDDFLNIALLASDAGLDARGWLDRCRGLERAARRERLVRWGPRTLDADVIGVWGGDATRPVDRGAGADTAAGDDGDDGVPGRALSGGPSPAWDERDAVLSADPALTVPHPRAFERAFVLLPWAEIQPEAVLPGHGRIRDLLTRLDTADIDLIGPLFPSDGPDQGAWPRGAAEPGRRARRDASSTPVLLAGRPDRAEPR